MELRVVETRRRHFRISSMNNTLNYTLKETYNNVAIENKYNIALLPQEAPVLLDGVVSPTRVSSTLRNQLFNVILWNSINVQLPVV